MIIPTISHRIIVTYLGGKSSQGRWYQIPKKRGDPYIYIYTSTATYSYYTSAAMAAADERKIGMVVMHAAQQRVKKVPLTTECGQLNCH